MTRIIFETKGKLDLRAITTFGCNAKPNTNSPIGFFGTGLKYAISVLLRNEQSVELVTGGKRYTFGLREKTFREKPFSIPVITTSGGKTKELPFTTELGKNWELWQAFRELFSNTLDENGFCAKYEIEEPDYNKSCTYFIVSGDNFAQEYDRCFTHTFLQEGLETRSVGAGVQIIDRESKAIYYRGVRVAELRKPSLFTYNILSPITLTEDRTAKHVYEAEIAIVNQIISLSERDTLNRILNAEKESWESQLDFSYCWQICSPEFISVGEASINTTARKLIRSKSDCWINAPLNERLANCITDNDWQRFKDIAEENAADVYKILMGKELTNDDSDNNFHTF